MDRQTAEQLIAAIAKLDAVIGEIYEISEGVDDVALRKKIRLVTGGFGIDVHTEITLPIANEYPDLHPDRAELESPKSE